MRLFRPCYIAKLHTGGINRLPISDFQEIEPGYFESKKHNFSISLYDSLKDSVNFSLDHVLSSFSHWCWTTIMPVTIGNTVRIETPLPPDHSIFATPLPAAVMGSSKGQHFFPHLFLVETNIILIGSTSHETPTENPIGSQMEMIITVYAYNSRENPGWKRILYDSLSDLSLHRWDVAIFKLATAIELFADAIFDGYLVSKTVPDHLRKRIVRSARNWDSKLERVLDVLAAMDGSATSDKITGIVKSQFAKKVRSPRNDFAHGDPEYIGPDEAHDAFKAAFDLIWTFDHLAAATDCSN